MDGWTLDNCTQSYLPPFPKTCITQSTQRKQTFTKAGHSLSNIYFRENSLIFFLYRFILFSLFVVNSAVKITHSEINIEEKL